ncbi:MAG TPA: hypothetical protein VJ819_00040 [Nocardioidaceae bacterium]|nr:hypothetical protein [Nocardioidaceae bacterium]
MNHRDRIAGYLVFDVVTQAMSAYVPVRIRRFGLHTPGRDEPELGD